MTQVPPSRAQIELAIIQDKDLRKTIDSIIQNIRGGESPIRASRERSLAITKLQEAVMWLGMDLKAINDECPGIQENPYPDGKNPANLVIEPVADGLRL